MQFKDIFNGRSGFLSKTSRRELAAAFAHVLNNEFHTYIYAPRIRDCGNNLFGPIMHLIFKTYPATLIIQIYHPFVSLSSVKRLSVHGKVTF